MAKLRGKVVLLHFWTNGCYNCVNNYPHYKAWQERYADKDVVIVGVHTPETAGEHDLERIKAQAAKHGLKFPIAVDNDGSNWKAWNNRYWPTVYVVDRRGRVRYGWEGELNIKVRPAKRRSASSSTRSCSSVRDLRRTRYASGPIHWLRDREYPLTGPLVQYHHQTHFRLVDGASGFPLPQLSKEPGC